MKWFASLTEKMHKMHEKVCSSF